MIRSALGLLVLVALVFTSPAPAAAQSDERLVKARGLLRDAGEDLRLGRAREGVPKAREALTLREAVLLGANHSAVSFSLNYLGIILASQGDYGERVLGPDHATTASSLNSLGELLQETGDYAGARALHERALLATHGVLDLESPERSYLLVAGVDEASQRLSIAETAGLSLQRGLAILSAYDTAVGEQVPGAALITLAAVFSQAGAEAIIASLWKVNDAIRSTGPRSS